MSSGFGGDPRTRERILEAALDSLAEGSEDALNVSAVARRAGVSRQAVYLHFPGRGVLGVAAARYLDEREDLESALAPVVAATTPEATLDAYAAFLGAYNPRIASFVRAADRLRYLTEIEEMWQDRLAARRGGAAAIAKRIRDAGRLASPFTVATAGDWLTAMGSVPLWQELTFDLGWSARRYVSHLSASFRATLLV